MNVFNELHEMCLVRGGSKY